VTAAVTAGSYDVVVVGGGNAGLCAALAAREAGASVLLLERAPAEERGGNSAFTSGAMRVVYGGVDDIRQLVDGLTDEQVARTDFGTYPASAFLGDLARVTDGRTDPDLAAVLVGRSFETLRWMRGHGVGFHALYDRQAFEVGGRFVFWGGLTVEADGGGRGLVDALTGASRAAGVAMRYGTRAESLVTAGGRVAGVRASGDGREETIGAAAVVLASGGFEANAEWRTRYLGPGWDLAKVRGTRFNTGDGIRMALDAGAMPWGHWSGSHAVAWDFDAPAYGDRAVGAAFSKLSYPLSIMVNARGERFVDEGADFRNYTYAKYGRRILEQPGQFAWQVFDRKVSRLLRQEYRTGRVTKVTAGSLDELAGRLDGVDPDGFARTVRDYNAAVVDGVPFDPSVRDGRRTVGLAVDKTNWALALDAPPFEAYRVTCGITFTFGGLRITTDARVVDQAERPIPGLYACGELVGGLFYFNYPGGSGLTSGAVFGRIAGTSAARFAAVVA